jgi:hypothetical protein
MRGNRLMRTAFRALRSRLLNNRRDAIENVVNPDPVAARVCEMMADIAPTRRATAAE